MKRWFLYCNPSQIRCIHLFKVVFLLPHDTKKERSINVTKTLIGLCFRPHDRPYSKPLTAPVTPLTVKVRNVWTSTSTVRGKPRCYRHKIASSSGSFELICWGAGFTISIPIMPDILRPPPPSGRHCFETSIIVSCLLIFFTNSPLYPAECPSSLHHT